MNHRGSTNLMDFFIKNSFVDKDSNCAPCLFLCHTAQIPPFVIWHHKPSIPACLKSTAASPV